MPFDRLVSAVDEWAHQSGRNDVFAQIGDSVLKPQHIRWEPFLEPPRFRQVAQESSVIIAHAGTGSILTAMELGKPVIVMPRRGELLETRNDHQVETAKRFRELGRIDVAMNEDELREILTDINRVRTPKVVGPHASPELLGAVRDFLAASVASGRA